MNEKNSKQSSNQLTPSLLPTALCPQVFLILQHMMSIHGQVHHWALKMKLMKAVPTSRQAQGINN